MSRMDIDNMKIAHDVQLSLILLYDHLLTIGSEIQHIWVMTNKRSSIWFLLIRYFSFAGNIVMALDTFGDFGLEVCGKLRVTTGLVIVAQELIIGCTLVLRVYALYSLNRRIMYLLLCAGVVIVSVGAVSVVQHLASADLTEVRSRLLCPAIESPVSKLYVNGGRMDWRTGRRHPRHRPDSLPIVHSTSKWCFACWIPLENYDTRRCYLHLEQSLVVHDGRIISVAMISRLDAQPACRGDR
ncbi:hypothetical protein B0H14DRAFT_2873438 [Mycena olivaceomarginata]|nr:hypothetical protein B0H14DRAFT_2873438 [Mycena olivaceomarginata]